MDIPGFTLKEKIGQSSMTEVWEGYQPSLQRTVTLKILRKEFSSVPEEVELFHSEARETARLLHDGIVQLYDAIRLPDCHCLVMEHVTGPTLGHILQNGPIAPDKAISIIGQVAEALKYAWNSSNLIHRNITPRSIMMDGPVTAKLGYVGQSLRVDPMNPDKRLIPGMIVGTPYYMSPEQAMGSTQFDFRADMYGLGTTLHHMLTGIMPFADLSSQDALKSQIFDEISLPKEFEQHIPPVLLEIYKRLLMKNPNHRFPKWEEVCDCIAEYTFETAEAEKENNIQKSKKHRRIVVHDKPVSRISKPKTSKYSLMS